MLKSVIAKQYFDMSYHWLMAGISGVFFLCSIFIEFELEKSKLNLVFPDIFLINVKSYIPLFLFVSASFAVILFLCHLVFCKPTIKLLRTELDNAKGKNNLIGDNVRSFFESYLYQLSKKLDFGNKQSNSERVTIYLHQSSAGRFVPFGRFSANPKFANQRRSQYPDDEGCIAKGWENGWHFDNKLGTGDNYKNTNRNKYKMKKETINNIRMQSKLYAVKRIDADGEKLAVLVVESMESNRFTQKKLRTQLEDEKAYLAEMIVKLRDYIPISNYAKERGL